MSAAENQNNEVGLLQWARLAPLAAACARQLCKAALQCPAASGLTETEWLVLLSCGQVEREGLSQVELCQAIGVSPAQASTVVERLRKADLLLGRRSPLDRRRQMWTLSAQGRERYCKILHGLNERFAPLGTLISGDRRRRMEEVLQLIAQFDGSPQLRIHSPGDSSDGASVAEESA